MQHKILLTVISLAALSLAGCTANDEPNTNDVMEDENTTAPQLLTLYDDLPYTGGQDTPSHTWLVTGDELTFLHWNDADPAKATGLLFVGDGFRANGCIGTGGISPAQIEAGYEHFHKAVSETWAAGHHTDPANANLDGWWLRHIAAAPGVDPMGVGASEVGSVYPLMPSWENAPACVLPS